MIHLADCNCIECEEKHYETCEHGTFKEGDCVICQENWDSIHEWGCLCSTCQERLGQKYYAKLAQLK